MTPERARVLSEEHACWFIQTDVGYKIQRQDDPKNNYGFITALSLSVVGESDFINYYIPVKRS